MNSLIMNWYGDVWVDEPHKLNALFPVHGNHQERYLWTWNCGSTQMDQHQIDVLPLVALGNLLEFRNQQRVAGYVYPAYISHTLEEHTLILYL